MAGVYLQKNEIGFKYTGVTVTVPDNDVARLMYYLQCVCTAIELEQDSEVRHFTNYHNWARLSIEEQKVLFALCGTFSPEILEDKVFFHNEELCDDSLNDFLEISQVRHQFLAAESIVIAGQTREVNKIMVYKTRWMQKNYWNPMKGLLQKLRSLERPAITHTPPPRSTYTSTPRPTHTSTYRSTPSTPLIPPVKQRRCTKPFLIGTFCGFLFGLALVIAIIVYFFVLK